MEDAADALARAIAALTYDEIAVIAADGMGTSETDGRALPLLERSISADLIRMEMCMAARGKTLLSAIAASIDEALIAIEEARDIIAKGGCRG